MKFNDPAMTEEMRKDIRNRFADHLETLRQIQLGVVERATKYLLGANGGGVIATLSFMGAMHELRQSKVAWAVLSAFLLGVILCGVQIAIDYHAATANMDGWIDDWGRCNRGEIEHEAVVKNLNARTRRFPIAVVAGYAAFISFIVGSVLAVFGLRP